MYVHPAPDFGLEILVAQEEVVDARNALFQAETELAEAERRLEVLEQAGELFPAFFQPGSVR